MGATWGSALRHHRIVPLLGGPLAALLVLVLGIDLNSMPAWALGQ